MKTYRNTLQIVHTAKGIPYGSKTRDDGVNHGFMYLKGNQQVLDTVPELQGDPHLKRLVEAINDPQTRLFSIGCLSDPVGDSQGFRRSGYVEFAIDSVQAEPVRNFVCEA